VFATGIGENIEEAKVGAEESGDGLSSAMGSQRSSAFISWLDTSVEKHA